MISPSESKLLNFVSDHQKKSLYTPSRREIADFLEISVVHVSRILKSLENKKMIERTPGYHRNIKILQTPSELFKK